MPPPLLATGISEHPYTTLHTLHHPPLYYSVLRTSLLRTVRLQKFSSAGMGPPAESDWPTRPGTASEIDGADDDRTGDGGSNARAVSCSDVMMGLP
jgi:hypothetical protein